MFLNVNSPEPLPLLHLKTLLHHPISMENAGTLHSPSERFIGHSDIPKALRCAVMKREKAKKLFMFNPAFPSLSALRALFLRCP